MIASEASVSSDTLPPIAILAGGLATRMLPLTQRIPKSLLLVNGEPFIAHQLKLLASRGIRRVVLCVGHMGEMIQAFVEDGSRFGLSVEFSFDGPTLRGTAGAVKKALPLLGPEFFVLYGDSYLPCDYRAVWTAFQTSAQYALMTVFRNAGKWDASNIEFSRGEIRSYNKKHPNPAMEYIDYGLGLFRESAFATLGSDRSTGDLADLYQQLLVQGRLAGFEVHQRFYEIGSVAGLEELSDHLAGSKITQ